MKAVEVSRASQDLQTQVKRIRDFNGSRFKISIRTSAGKLISYKDDDDGNDDFGAFVSRELKREISILIRFGGRTLIREP